MAEVINPLVDKLYRAMDLLAEVRDQLAAQPVKTPAKKSGDREILFGAKVSQEFKDSVLWIEAEGGPNADHLMACMAFETGRSFSPAVKNLAGSSGLGLIQFMRATHANLLKAYPQLAKMAPTHADLGKLSAVQQLGFVYYYFKAFGQDLSNWTLEDTYMAILYPKAIGKPLSWVMPWKYGSLAYKQNAGLDANKDQIITKAEACAGVRRMASLGEKEKG